MLRWWSKAVNRSCFLSFADFRTPSNPWGSVSVSKETSVGETASLDSDCPW